MIYFFQQVRNFKLHLEIFPLLIRSKYVLNNWPRSQLYLETVVLCSFQVEDSSDSFFRAQKGHKRVRGFYYLLCASVLSR